MADLEVRNLTKVFSRAAALRGVDLEVPSGKCVAVVGPSGSGKTTLLRIIAGLETASEGAVSIDGQRIDRLPPHRRGVTMVFQDFPLYPHMTVRRNLEFPLRMKGVARPKIDGAVQQAATVLGLRDLLERKPGALSGGEQQRVALGRVLVSGAKIALLDEPLSNLDVRLRDELRRELKSIQRKLAITMLYVTHDLEEAAAVGDRLAVMIDGRIEQVGCPKELRTKPTNQSVADFLGLAWAETRKGTDDAR